ncbi:MAG: hypothetical protein ACK5Y0_18415, partial [Pseudomonadota bacterium]
MMRRRRFVRAGATWLNTLGALDGGVIWLDRLPAGEAAPAAPEDVAVAVLVARGAYLARVA